jgi:uncharacterized protein with NAD-binding domain and iron-sulfur cluster
MTEAPAEVDVLVVGAGQAGLGGAYWLTRRPHPLPDPRRDGGVPVSLLGIDLYWWSYLSGVLNAGKDSRASSWIDVDGAVDENGASTSTAPHRSRACTGWACRGRPG